jgi:hypothetical protein
VKWLFTVKLEGREVVVTRFRYGCSSTGSRVEATEAHYPGGWTVVVTEKTEGQQLQLPITRKVQTTLKNAVEKMHSAGYAHILRPQNIMLAQYLGY